MIIQNPLLTGSLNYNGADLSNVTSSNANSASVSLILTAVSSSNQQLSASYIALSASYNVFSGSASTRVTTVSASQQDISSSLLQVSASYIALSGSYNTFSGSASTRVTKIENNYATTGSNSFRADQSITGSLVVSSTITAQTLVVQTVTSSIVYSSGSNNFGNQLSNNQTFTGSIYQTGSIVSFAGSVGINNSVPSNQLHIIGIDGSNFTDGIRVARNGTPSQYATLNMAGGSYNFLATNTTTGTPSFYWLTSINGINTTTSMVLSGGNLGIGTTSPSYLLHAYSTASSAARFYLQGTSNFVTTQFGNTGGTFYIGIDDSAGANFTGTAYGRFLYSSGAYPLIITVNSIERMRMTSAGNLIVGNSAYDNTTTDLSITGDKVNSDGYYSRLIFQNSSQSGGSSASIRGERKTSNYATELTFYTNIASSAGSGLERMRITNAGNIGIGSSAPAYTLDVSGTGRFLTSAIATKFNTFNGDISVPYNTATFIVQCAADGGQASMYLIVAAIGGAGTENIAMGILVTISQGGGTARWAFQNNGANVTLTDPGSNGNVYVTQTKSASAQTVNYSILRIG